MKVQKKLLYGSKDTKDLEETTTCDKNRTYMQKQKIKAKKKERENEEK